MHALGHGVKSGWYVMQRKFDRRGLFDGHIPCGQTKHRSRATAGNMVSEVTHSKHKLFREGLERPLLPKHCGMGRYGLEMRLGEGEGRK